jgi:hypothetical protein
VPLVEMMVFHNGDKKIASRTTRNMSSQEKPEHENRKGKQTHMNKTL